MVMRNELFTAEGRLIEVTDLDAGLFQRFDVDGKEVERRTLTADEITALTPLPPVPTADDRLAAATQALAALDNISAPVLPVDVLDILTDLRSALEA